MALTVGVLSETHATESRVALIPDVAAKFTALGARVLVQANAGGGIRIPDAAYTGCEVIETSALLLSQCDVLLKVNPPTSEEVRALRPGKAVIGFMQAQEVTRTNSSHDSVEDEHGNVNDEQCGNYRPTSC